MVVISQVFLKVKTNSKDKITSTWINVQRIEYSDSDIFAEKARCKGVVGFLLLKGNLKFLLSQ